MLSKTATSDLAEVYDRLLFPTFDNEFIKKELTICMIYELELSSRFFCTNYEMSAGLLLSLFDVLLFDSLNGRDLI